MGDLSICQWYFSISLYQRLRINEVCKHVYMYMSYLDCLPILVGHYTLLLETKRLQAWRSYINTPRRPSKSLFNTNAPQKYLDDPEHGRSIVSSDTVPCISHVYEANAPLKNPLAHLSAPTGTLNLRKAAPRPILVARIDP